MYLKYILFLLFFQEHLFLFLSLVPAKIFLTLNSCLLLSSYCPLILAVSPNNHINPGRHFPGEHFTLVVLLNVIVGNVLQ